MQVGLRHKAPSARRCIKTGTCREVGTGRQCHKAPSARRCIKTGTCREVGTGRQCHKAPSARRCIKTGPQVARPRVGVQVIKHRAPDGALRLLVVDLNGDTLIRHKAPSARRCIKTLRTSTRTRTLRPVIKHRAPNGALRHTGINDGIPVLELHVIKHRAPNGALRQAKRALLHGRG